MLRTWKAGFEIPEISKKTLIYLGQYLNQFSCLDLLRKIFTKEFTSIIHRHSL